MVAPFRAWPYAALAVCQWLYTTPSLFVYVVFRHPMDQTVKPPHAKWIVVVDGVPKTPAASAWIDDWTLLLTITLDGVLPTSVTVEYDGPDENLITTWGKQWEPWGAIVATSFEVIPYGVIVMWPHAIADIPSGWVLCDGNNGTPDLHGLFPVGTTNPAAVGNLGGAANHDHTFIGDGHFHQLQTGPSPIAASGPNVRIPTTSTSAVGTTDTEVHYPPFIRLAFIMKV